MKRLATVLIIVTVLALAFALTGCSNGGTFTAEEYLSQGRIIEAIDINVTDREITIGISDDNQVHIDYFASEKECYGISISGDNTLVMTSSYNKHWTDYIGKKPAAEYRKISIKIPNMLLASISITTTNETIKLLPISAAESITLSSNGGSIEFERINVWKALTLAAKNGNIKGTVIGSYDEFAIACNIKKGESNLPLAKTDGEKLLKASCNNGNIEIDFVKE